MNYMTRYDMNSNQKLERSKQAVPLRRTTSFLTANSHFAYGGLMRSFLFTLLFLLTGVTGVWGQSAGLYYIANNNQNPYEFNSNTNWYLVPASDGKEANIDINRWAWQNNAATPFVTTYRTQKDNNFIWAIVESDSKYRIIHVLTGKYS